MQLDREQLRAAHELGEAILRFIQTFLKEPTAPATWFVPIPESAAPRTDGERLLRASEAAHLLSIGRSMIYDLMNSGRLPSVKIGGARRFKLSEVMKLIDNNSFPPG